MRPTTVVIPGGAAAARRAEVRGGTATTRATPSIQVRGGAATTRATPSVQVRGGDATVRVAGDRPVGEIRRAPPTRVDVRHPGSGGGRGVIVRGRGPTVVVNEPPTLIAQGDTYVDYGVDIVEHHDWGGEQPFVEEYVEEQHAVDSQVEVVEHGGVTYVDGQVVLEPMSDADYDHQVGMGVPAPLEAPEPPFQLRGRMGINAGYTLTGAVRGSFDAQISFARGFELDLGYAGYVAKEHGQTEAIGIGRFAMNYRFGTERVYARIGSGIRRFRDFEGALTGIDAGVGFGIQRERVRFTADGTAGVIGSAFILGARIELAVSVLPSVQIVLGLDHLSLVARDLVGPPVQLTTPNLGIRLTTR